jgi:hypothetical protein
MRNPEVKANRTFLLSLPLALTLLACTAGAALADPRGHDSGREQRQDRDSRGDRGRAEGPRGYVFDRRYNHDRYYPPRGFAVRELPRAAYYTRYRGGRPYYFHEGVWYRRSGLGFVVIAPPFGIGIPVLPPFYTTIWVGGIPYYYADDTYYVWRPEAREYVVTEPPQDAAAASTTPDRDDELYVYPRKGQSSTDRYECHSWAVQQTGYDPTEPLGGVDESQVTEKRADYRRAETACLEARGYSVK